jgi:hypothetical protein
MNSERATSGSLGLQRKLTTPDSPKRLQRQHTHKRHATPAPAHTTPGHSDLLCTACAPTSTHSNGLYAIWVCISSSSSSGSLGYLPREVLIWWRFEGTWAEQNALRSNLPPSLRCLGRAPPGGGRKKPKPSSGGADKKSS